MGPSALSPYLQFTGVDHGGRDLDMAERLLLDMEVLTRLGGSALP